MKLFSVFYMEELDEKLCDDEKFSQGSKIYTI